MTSSLSKCSAEPAGRERVVFFSIYLPEDYHLYAGGSLRQGRIPMDRQVAETIGLRPDWRELPGRSAFFMFNLHSLRFAYDLIRPAELGDRTALLEARDLLLDWNDKNRPPRGVSETAWGDEHSVSWRSVVLGYFWQVWRRASVGDERTSRTVQAMAAEHGSYLLRPSIYNPHHNHGANNALGLLALGASFDELPQSERWLDAALARAEQQMRDNVSDDGIHLEQSGFYHCYTMRALLEIERVARLLDRPLSPAYLEKLDRMLDAAASIAGTTGVIQGLPYSYSRTDALREYPLRGAASVSPHLTGQGAARLRSVLAGRQRRCLTVFRQGGYSFFEPGDPEELDVVFHTRILDANHGQQDALGVAARIGELPLVVLPSTMYTGDRAPAWHAHFMGPRAHNTVQVDDLPQATLPRRRAGIAARILDSWKVKHAVRRVGLAERFVTFREACGLGYLPLRERLTAQAGEVLHHESRDDFDVVTARHHCYRGVSHTRCVLRVGRLWLVVWDRLASDEPHRYVQTWHFHPSASVALEGDRGRVSIERETRARFAQLAPDTHPRICRGELTPERCGWFAASPGEPIPSPTLHHELEGRSAQFLWVLHAGSDPIEADATVEGGPEEAKWMTSLGGGGEQVDLSLGEGEISCEIRR